MFLRIFTVSASAKELIELLWNAIGGKFNTVQEGDNSWFRKTVKVFSRVPWLVGYIYIFYYFFIFSNIVILITVYCLKKNYMKHFLQDSIKLQSSWFLIFEIGWTCNINVYYDNFKTDFKQNYMQQNNNFRTCYL